MTVEDVVRIAAPIATLLAATVALFKEDLQALWRAPILRMRLSLDNREDSHKTFYTGSNAPVFFIRAWVVNDGKTRAEDVRIVVSRLLRQGSSAGWERVLGFQPMSLKWAHGGGSAVLDRLGPGGIGRHCDFAHVIQEPTALSKSYGPVAAQMELELEAPPNTGGHRIMPHYHLVELRIAASNAKPESQWFLIDFKGVWYESEDEMFSKGLRITSSPPPSEA